jgi:hypothetical protein
MLRLIFDSGYRPKPSTLALREVLASARPRATGVAQALRDGRQPQHSGKWSRRDRINPFKVQLHP